jgi:hypothetical protein
MYSFAPTFRDPTFCGVLSCVADESEYVAGDKILRNTDLDDLIICNLKYTHDSMTQIEVPHL